MVDERSGDWVDTAPGKDRERSEAARPHAGLLTTSSSLFGATLDPDPAAFARPTAISSWPESCPRSATVKARTAALKTEYTGTPTIGTTTSADARGGAGDQGNPRAIARRFQAAA
jgi:hypothetical protein